MQLSQGPEYVQIPSVIGQEVEQAVSALEQAGFQVETRDMLGGHSSTVRLQTPLNQQAERGATITLYVF
ncbi:PASTA domain-containing protein [Arthrobacter sp. JCM 19049]|uniref:PASTA domain-containing protein n=1 Tax=Arthrobacter sp. JCM 19049 TaxID=1460643 RepID=UPI0006CF884D|nr:PASTA domain-containing protein [Arthrobacter sp. JCM 19049]